MRHCVLATRRCELTFSRCELAMRRWDLTICRCDLTTLRCEVAISRCEVTLRQCDLAPCRASPSARACPKPRAEPVTIATRFEREKRSVCMQQVSGAFQGFRKAYQSHGLGGPTSNSGYATRGSNLRGRGVELHDSDGRVHSAARVPSYNDQAEAKAAAKPPSTFRRINA